MLRIHCNGVYVGHEAIKWNTQYIQFPQLLSTAIILLVLNKLKIKLCMKRLTSLTRVYNIKYSLHALKLYMCTLTCMRPFKY